MVVRTNCRHLMATDTSPWHIGQFHHSTHIASVVLSKNKEERLIASPLKQSGGLLHLTLVGVTAADAAGLHDGLETVGFADGSVLRFECLEGFFDLYCTHVCVLFVVFYDCRKGTDKVSLRGEL